MGQHEIGLDRFGDAFVEQPDVGVEPCHTPLGEALEAGITHMLELGFRHTSVRL